MLDHCWNAVVTLLESSWNTNCDPAILTDFVTDPNCLRATLQANVRNADWNWENLGIYFEDHYSFVATSSTTTTTVTYTGTRQ